MKAPRSRPKSAWWILVAAVLAVAALAAAWRYTPLSGFFNAQRIARWANVVDDTWWAPFAIVAAYTPATFLMFPRPLITLLAVLAFGPWLGFTYAMTGICLAALAAYSTGRRLPRETVERLAGEKIEPVRRALQRHGLIATFAIRIVPVAPAAVADMVAGALRTPLWQYELGTFLGMAPGVLATSVFAHQINVALRDVSQVSGWLIAAGIVLIALMAAAALAARRWLMK